MAGEREGAAARLAWNRMPRKALLRKACGERSEDFYAAVRRKSNGIFQAVEKVSGLFRQPGAEPGRAPLSLHSEGLRGFYAI